MDKAVTQLDKIARPCTNPGECFRREQDLELDRDMGDVFPIARVVVIALASVSLPTAAPIVFRPISATRRILAASSSVMGDAT
jgi:hypothetical protein